MKTLTMLLFAATTAIVFSGCGPGVPAGKVKVTGTVLKDGAPLAISPPATGGLNFAAREGTDSGSTTIDAGGKFTVILSPGTYAVSVLAKDGVDTMDEDGKPVRATSLVKSKYESTATSGLEVTVTADGAPVAINVD